MAVEWQQPDRWILSTSILISDCGFRNFFVATNYMKSKRLIAPLPPGPQLAGVYGPIYKLWLGKKLCVVISSPSLVKEVVRDHDITFSERNPPIVGQKWPDIVFDSYSSPSWKKKRQILAAELLGNATLNACYGLRREQVMKTIADVYKNDGKPIDIGELAYLTAMNTITSTLWGGKVRGETAAKISGHFDEISQELMVLLGKPNISDIFPEFAWLEIQLYKNVATDKEVDGKGEKKIDLLQMLLGLQENEDRASSITMDQLKGILMEIVLGTTDTTSTTLECTMAELIRHPEIMEKVKKEITDVVGLNNRAEESHLPNLRYLNAVIKETFRLHPALPLLVPRSPDESITIGGYTVPKGSKVFLNIWSIQRDPHVSDNPSEFQPERCLNDPDKFDYLGNDFRYMPFGSGRRKCPGISLGEKMPYFMLTSFLHSFEWKLPHGTEHDLSTKFGIVMKKKNPLLLIPHQDFWGVLNLAGTLYLGALFGMVSYHAGLANP
ncbi:hypothetical protein DITRI_Ditri04bG0062500 [Diplodiscus trichospermus]